MLLPNADAAHVPLEKLTGYSLSPTNAKGKHKARVFRSALGLGLEDAPWLRDRILEAVREHDALEREPTAYGRRYVVDFLLSTDVGTALVRSAWMVRYDESIPRLTSCYVP